MAHRALVGIAWLAIGCGPAPATTGVALDATFEPGRVALRSGGAAVGLSLRAWGAADAPVAAEPVAPVEEGGRARYLRPGVVEDWLDTPFGLEHRFVVAEPPRGELVLDLALDGAAAVVDPGGRSATFAAGGGDLRYEGLFAWDERGDALPARMEALPSGLRLVVDATDAVGAVTVDPLFPGSAGHVESNQDLAALGWSVAGAGDVNGDGFDDLLAGAPRWDDGQFNEGAAFLSLGSAAGPQPGIAWTVTSDQANAQLGMAVSSAGDVNGDGFDDVVVGAPFRAAGQNNEGAAFVHLGSAAGLSAVAAWTGEPDQAGAQLGGAVASAGDVDGDGFAEVLAGAARWDGGQTDEGAAFLYAGSAAGPSAAPTWTAEADLAGALLGTSVAGAGDLNGDGLADVAVGAPGWDGGQAGEGAALVYLGAPGGLAWMPSWYVEPNQAGAALGTSVASAGDVDGDGYGDLVLGAIGWDGAQVDGGAAFLHRGSAAGPRAASWSARGEAGSLFGQSVASAGDLDGDGFDDLLVGAPEHGTAFPNEGAAYLWFGAPGGPAAAPAVVATAGTAATYYGCAVASAGDVNGDALGDVLVGALAHNNPEQDEGAVILYLGR